MKQSISLNAARAFIEAHFDEPVTLAQLAALSARHHPKISPAVSTIGKAS